MHDDNLAHGEHVLNIRLPRALSSLKYRDYSLFSAGQLISLTGTWMQNTAQGWLVYELTGSEVLLGTVAAMATIPVLFLTLPAGTIADRWPKRKLLLVTQSVLLIQAMLLGILDSTGAIKVWHILALALIAGIANAMDAPARQSFTVELVGKEDLLNGIALNSAIFNFTRIIGPIIAGLVIAKYNTHACFILNAFSYLAALTALLLMRATKAPIRKQSRSILQDTADGVKYALKNLLVRNLLIMTAVVSIFCVQYGTLLPAYAKATLHLDARGLGLLMSAAGIGALLGAGIVATTGHRVKNSIMISAGSFIIPLGLIAVAYARSLHLAMFSIAVVGLGMMSFLAVSNSVIQISAPDEMRARIVSVRTLVFMGMAPVGSMLMGWLAQHYSVSFSMFFGAVICLLAAILMLIFGHSIPKNTPGQENTK